MNIRSDREIENKGNALGDLRYERIECEGRGTRSGHGKMIVKGQGVIQFKGYGRGFTVILVSFKGGTRWY